MNIIVTTTDRIENCNVTGYLGILRSSVVVGNEIALTDFFSDQTRKYNRKLDSVYNKALQEIKLKAQAVGADAVIGLHSEFEEIFAKGKTRFIVSLLGTAVRLNQCNSIDKKQGGGVSQFDLRRTQLSLSLARKLQNPNFTPSVNDWDNIQRYALHDLALPLYKRYLVLASETIGNTSPSEKKLFLDSFIPFLQDIEYASAVNVVYSDTQTAPYVFKDVVKSCNLFHPEKICSMLSAENKHTVISLLDCDKPYYTEEDLKYMTVISEYLDNLPDTGKYIEGREGLFSKTGTLLVCERGHTSAVELGGHCKSLIEGSGAICNLNVKGITEDEVAAIKSYKEKIEILKGLVNCEQ